jgi:hypothetical protein
VQDEWRERCPNLRQVLGAYLHQDFDLEYANAEAALADAVASQSREQVALASIELATFRPSNKDEVSSMVFTNAMCDYNPPGDGLTFSAWLDRVQDVLSRAARS